MEQNCGVEVELKFHAENATHLCESLRELGGRAEEPILQSDTYFAHPVRDFAQTDEALRVRIVGETGCVTYKGPLLDAETKSREETELWFRGGASDASRFGKVLEKLGFHPVRSVRKRRTPWSLEWQSRQTEVVFDEVEDLGIFIELETAASTDDFGDAKRSLLALAERLGLHNSERRSYLALLIARDTGGAE